MSKKIFGYGSLINKYSLTTTAPYIKNFRPCYIKGFLRRFDVKSANRYCDKSGKWCSALNLIECEYDNNWLGGVCFDVEEEDFIQLKEREKNYIMKEVMVYDLDGMFIDSSFVFYSKSNDYYDYIEGNPKQEEYLRICLDGAMSFGDEFFSNFCNTTYIKGKILKEYLQYNKFNHSFNYLKLLNTKSG